MANQKSYNEVIKFLSGFTANHKQVKAFGNGFRFDLNWATTLTNNHPLIYVEPLNHQFIEWTQVYSLRIYCLDVKQKDSSNETEVISDTLQILNDIVKYIKNADEDWDVANEPLAVAVTNYTTEFTCGWYFDIDIETTINDGNCDIPLNS